MVLTTYFAVAAVIGQGQFPADTGLQGFFATSTALVAVGVLFSAIHKVAQLVTILLAAAAAVGNVILVMAVFCGLFIAAWLMGVPH